MARVAAGVRGGVARRSGAGRARRRGRDGAESPGGERPAVVRTGTALRSQLPAANFGWRAADDRVAPGAAVLADAGNLAAALRDGRRERGCILSADRPADGSVFHGTRGSGSVRTSGFVGLVYGGGIWRFAHRFWPDHRAEVRWLRAMRRASRAQKWNEQ